MSRALGLEPVPGRGAVAGRGLPAVACLLLGIAVAQPAVTTTTERSARTSSQVVFVTDVSRSMTGRVAARARDPARSGAIDRDGAAGGRARRAGRPQRAHRPRPAVRLPDARPATSPTTLARQRPGRVAAAAGRLGRRHELRAALAARARRVLRAGHRASHLRPRHGRRDAHRRLVERRLQPPRRQGGGGARPHLRGATARSTPRTAPRARRRAPSTGSRGQRAALPTPRADVGAAAEALRRLAEVGPSTGSGPRSRCTRSRRSSPPSPSSLLRSTSLRRYLRPAGGVSLVRRHRRTPRLEA